MQAQTPYGSYLTVEERPALRFERRLNHPVEAVWRSVTEPAELAHWFPAQVAVDDLRVGARMRFTFPGHAFPPTAGEVTECDPPRRFAFDWGEEHLRFEIEPDGDGAVLRFTHVLSERDAAARDAAGWHVCLDKLDVRLAGGAPEAPGTEPTPEHDELKAAYERRGLPTGAEMPG